jgi:hypothetical protein
MLIYLIGISAMGVLLLFAIGALFYPWSFYMGGRFHPIPMWRGWGKLHSSSGRDYVLYVSLEPDYHSRHSGPYMGVASVQGWGTLCAPNGESYSVRLSGNMERHMGASTEGKHMYMWIHRWLWYYSWPGQWDRRPRIEFDGAWHNPVLVLHDGGSLDRAFNADGTLRSGPATRTPGERGIEVTLHEGSKSDFEAACARVNRQ